MDKKISVVINTYNAEKDLARVLESVKGFDEIVICDMESTDSTLNIAKKYDELHQYQPDVELHYDIQTVNAAPISNDF